MPEKSRTELAWLVLDESPGCLAENIQKFEIFDESVRIALAKIVAEREPNEFCGHIQNFEISDDESKLEIVRPIAKINSYFLAKNIQNFAFSGENGKMEFAQIIAEKEPVLFLRNIHKFKISNVSAKIGWAYKFAKKNLKELVDNFQNFEISNDSARIELVNKIAEKYLKNLSESFQNLENFNENERARVAYEASKRKLHSFTSHIQVFKISNESAKIELAKLIAEKCPEALAENFQKFEIVDERARIGLAKIIAEKDLELLVKNFQNFAISDESTKLELAQSLIRKHLATSLIDNGYFEKLQISNQSARGSLYASAYLGLITKGEMSAIDKTWINNFFPHDSDPMSLVQVATQFGSHHPVMADLLKAAEQQSDPYIREALSTWAQLVSLRFAANQLPEAAWQDLKVPLEAIQKWRAPAMRYVLTHLLAQQCLPPEAKDVNGFFAFCKQFTRPHTHLYPALLFPLFQSATNDPVLKNLMPLLHQSDFKDAKRQKAVLNALVTLVQADHLPDGLKRSLLQASLLNGRGREAALSLVKTAPLMECLVSLAQQSPEFRNVALQRLKSVRNPDNFNVQMNEVFKDLFPNLPKAQDVAAQFNHYRDHARHAMGLITYTVKMQNHRNNHEKALVLAAIDEFVNATVLFPDSEHTFRQLRYDSKKSAHLGLLATEAPAAFAQWQQSCNEESSSSRQDAERFTVIDTDAAEDLFLCGTEVADSCLTIHNPSHYNKPLMGYVLDGKYRMLAIKYKDGRLMGRRMLRLLWDEQKKQPVLYLEHFYQNPGIPEKYKQALVELALQKAKQMNCVLVSHDRESGLGDFYTAPLIAYPTPWPFEYVDGERPSVVTGKEGYQLSGASIVTSTH